MKRTLTIFAAASLCLSALAGNPKPFVIPELQEWKGTSGLFVPEGDMRIVFNAEELRPVAEALSEDWLTMFGRKPEITCGKAGKGDICLSLKKDRSLGEEGYSVKVKDGIQVCAPKAVGVYWATRTILQIAEQTPEHSFPKGEARDWPDYGFRGFMIDAGRKFIPMDYLKDLARIMSYYKMNVLHVHLNDCGFKQFFEHDWNKTYAAFRLECDTYPGLTARDGSYTKKEFGEFQDEAAGMFVNVIPEIDVPAHTLAFTQYKPELGSKTYGMDHLDLFYPGMYDFFDALFKEYLEGDKPVFRGPEVHIGTDEYSNRDQDVVEKFREFTDHYIRYVESFGKRACVWGSLTYAKGVTPVKSENVLMYTWSRDFSATADMFELGYKTVSIPDGYVYIVPAAGYYHDYLDIRRLYDRWTPAHTVDSVYQERHPNIEGGMFAVWNDNCGNGISVYDIHHRTMPALQTISVKTWNTGRTLGFEKFDLRRGSISEAPGINRLALVKEMSGEIFRADELAPGTEVPFREIGYDYTVSFTLEAADEPLGTKLFDSGRSIFYLSDPVSGKLGFARDGYLFTFNFRPYPGEKLDIRICGNNKSTSLFVNGQLQETLGIRKCLYENSNRPTYQVRTLAFPLGKACDFRSRITDFNVSNVIL
ncbi:MAG: family 20 glycosylhydrolase [Bacteroidales bacterium]|nr:family 20 glycosylhydrolase [Bacteroidales bacterium]